MNLFLYSMLTAVLLLAYWFELLDRSVLLCSQKGTIVLEVVLDTAAVKQELLAQ